MPRCDDPRRVPAASLGIARIIPLWSAVNSGEWLVIPLVVTGCGSARSYLSNTYTLAPVQDERISEAAGVNSGAGSFGLSFVSLPYGLIAGGLGSRTHSA